MLLFSLLESLHRLLFLLEYCLLFDDLANIDDDDGADILPPFEGCLQVKDDDLLPEESADVTPDIIFDMAMLAIVLAPDFISSAG